MDFHAIHSAGVGQALGAHQVSGQGCTGFLGTYTKYIERIPMILQKKRMMLILGFYCLYILFFISVSVYISMSLCAVGGSPRSPKRVSFHGPRTSDSWDLPGVGAG